MSKSQKRADDQLAQCASETMIEYLKIIGLRIELFIYKQSND